MDNAELAHLPTHQLAELIASGEMSPVEVTQLYLDRIDALDSQLNSYLTVTADLALEAARAAEEKVASGADLGPLHGVPIGIKDLQMTKGIRTTSGSLVFQDRVPDADSAVVERVLASGAIILGKTNTSEFGLLGANENLLGDDCRNPWNPERTSGASSGGAGAAVAAGLSSIATGGDGGGSIRIPASFCGIYGIKPTQGRVSSFSGVAAHAARQLHQPTRPHDPHRARLCHPPPGARRHDPRDVNSLRDPVPDFAAAVDRGVEGLRIGYSADFGYAVVDPEVAAICEKAAQAFSDLGCEVEESDLALESPFETWWTLFSTNAYATQGHLLADQSELLTWYARNAIEAGAKVSGVDYSRAVGERDRMVAQFAEQLDRFRHPAVAHHGDARVPGQAVPRGDSRPARRAESSLRVHALHPPHQRHWQRRRQRTLRLLVGRPAHRPPHRRPPPRRGDRHSGLSRLRAGPPLAPAPPPSELTRLDRPFPLMAKVRMGVKSAAAVNQPVGAGFKPARRCEGAERPPQITPASASTFSRSRLMPNSPQYTSSLCSPISGARREMRHGDPLKMAAGPG